MVLVQAEDELVESPWVGLFPLGCGNERAGFLEKTSQLQKPSRDSQTPPLSREHLQTAQSLEKAPAFPKPPLNSGDLLQPS